MGDQVTYPGGLPIILKCSRYSLTMAACGDIEFEIDEVSKPDSNNSSSHNVTHSENDQKDLRSYFSD